VFSLLLVFVFSGCKENETVKKENNKPVVKIDKQLLQGSWVRTDAEYQIKLSDVQDNGIIKAQYFNPRPINVSKSDWMNAEGFLKIYVELRDENYPGSNYNLTYIPERDMLVGDYFQAVEGVTYYIEFVRKN
jgi:competence protein ComGC